MHTQTDLQVQQTQAKEQQQKIQLDQLRHQMPQAFIAAEHVRPPEGLPTGIASLDEFLLWRGVPKGDLSLFHGKPGSGATSIFIKIMQQIHRQNKQEKWVAWINSDWEICPTHLLKKQIDLRRLLVVKKPEEDNKLFWILQELITSSLFEMLGCHLKEGSLKLHQLQKLKKLSRLHKVALVIISHARQWATQPIFSFVINCQKEIFTIQRALHRSTPFSFAAGRFNADFVHELTSSSRTLLR